MDYKETLNLPKTEFPMKANLPKREPELLQHWDSIKIYDLIKDASKGREKYILHDGPPYANGNIHLGTALNKVLKDIIVKSRFMMGYDSYYVPGWDCHGLPIEHQVDKELGDKKLTMTKSEIRKRCRTFAEKYIDIQRSEFKRLGIFGEWDDPYLTMDYEYEATIIKELGKFALSGSLYRGKKPVYWCASCVTALAEAEVEYMDHTSTSIYVKFPMIDDLSNDFPELKGKNVSVIIWTTTPWTIPANLAIAFHPDYEYVAAEVKGGEVFILAEELADIVLSSFKMGDYKVLVKFPGKSLEGKKAKHPLYDRESVLILADYVTLDAGTGAVHTAPGHGQDDYFSGQKYGLEAYAPVDDLGKFTDDVQYFAGKFVFDANEDVNKKLAETGTLLKEEEFGHQYPHCWRCKQPIIFRSTPQWFISMEENDLRKQALKEIDKVRWIPKWGRERIYGMIQNRPDWCISRQRSWGVPITVFYCTECGTELIDEASLKRVVDLVKEGGADVWFEKDVSELVAPGTECKNCGGKNFKKEEDILDVWFDSGTSYAAVCEKRPGLKEVADMYLEGSDQHRGWFHSSLLASVGTRGRAPYREVLTHGFLVAGDGRKMSKSLGNVMFPNEVIDKYGAEVLRLWVSAEDYMDDIRVSWEILDRQSEAYRRIRNTSRFILGNLFDFDPKTDLVDGEAYAGLDRYLLIKYNKLIKRVLKAYEEFEFHTIYHSIHNFCAVNLSAFYLDILKDRLYTSAAESKARKAAQSAMYTILNGLVRLMAPILVFTAEEIWGEIPGNNGSGSVHTTSFPRADDSFVNDDLEREWDGVLEIRGVVTKALEEARRNKSIGHSLDALVTISAKGKKLELLRANSEILRDVFIVSRVEIVDAPLEDSFESEEIEDLFISVKKAPGEKCPRCWSYTEDIGKDEKHPEVCLRCAGNLKEGGS
ncbi:MAG: isoleucine--tRNA ligase [Deltaproteobacteria bacterium]|uniref:Isoleucine--tRNA ligase n=1 Tax=Candidatus Zymogenus saltonus TaxID=2844893 RepID=A0A9D8PM90_9DELT|nr:isoleucine--tRNA ligase [Candidatus Zymogenus saltonus]